MRYDVAVRQQGTSDEQIVAIHEKRESLRGPTHLLGLFLSQDQEAARTASSAAIATYEQLAANDDTGAGESWLEEMIDAVAGTLGEHPVSLSLVVVGNQLAMVTSIGRSAAYLLRSGQAFELVDHPGPPLGEERRARPETTLADLERGDWLLLTRPVPDERAPELLQITGLKRAEDGADQLAGMQGVAVVAHAARSASVSPTLPANVPWGRVAGIGGALLALALVWSLVGRACSTPRAPAKPGPTAAQGPAAVTPLAPDQKLVIGIASTNGAPVVRASKPLLVVTDFADAGMERKTSSRFAANESAQLTAGARREGESMLTLTQTEKGLRAELVGNLRIFLNGKRVIPGTPLVSEVGARKEHRLTWFTSEAQKERAVIQVAVK